VYDPNRNDLFYATKGRGAFLNDKRLRVSRRIRMADTLIGTGFPFRKGDNFKRYLKMFEEIMQNCAGLRRPGAAALDLCYVAAGWYDGFFETGLNPWDVAAGSLMITEAGGLVGNFTGESDFLYQREVVAANPKIYAQMVKILAPYSRVIKNDDAAAAEEGSDDAASRDAVTALKALASSAVPGAAQSAAPAAAQTEGASIAAPARKAVRIRKADADAAGAAPAAAPADGGDTAPF
jgi:myo-inositol-1(or 4)-monophosphatase